MIRVRAVMNERAVPGVEQDAPTSGSGSAGLADPPVPEAPSLEGLPTGAQGGPWTDPEWDIVDEWGCGSFPASDPPANW